MVQHTVAGKLPYQNNLSTRSPSLGPCGANREMHMAARKLPLGTTCGEPQCPNVIQKLVSVPCAQRKPVRVRLTMRLPVGEDDRCLDREGIGRKTLAFWRARRIRTPDRGFEGDRLVAQSEGLRGVATQPGDEGGIVIPLVSRCYRMIRHETSRGTRCPTGDDQPVAPTWKRHSRKRSLLRPLRGGSTSWPNLLASWRRGGLPAPETSSASNTASEVSSTPMKGIERRTMHEL